MWLLPLSEDGSRIAALTLLFYMLAEIVFYVWYLLELRAAQAHVHPPGSSREERDLLLEKLLAHARDYGIWRQVQGWFLKEDCTSTCSKHEIGRENFSDLLSWAFLYKYRKDLDAEERVWIDEAVRRIIAEHRLESVIQEGRTSYDCVRHTLDPVRSIHRPLVFYFFVRFLDLCNAFILRCRGFRLGHHGCLRYWYLLPQQVGDDQPLSSADPTVFFHGIGLGLVTYLPLLLRLKHEAQFLFELPWVAMNPFEPIPTSGEYAEHVVQVLSSHGVDQCVAVGHSFGSLPVAWVLRSYPHFITRCVLVDPVALLLNLPDVCVNFLYKKPLTLHGLLLRCMGSREIGIARCLTRHFFWTESVLFPEQLPSGSTIILGENDHILPTRDIYNSAMKCKKVQTIVLRGLDHGHFLMHRSAMRLVVRHILRDEESKLEQ